MNTTVNEFPVLRNVMSDFDVTDIIIEVLNGNWKDVEYVTKMCLKEKMMFFEKKNVVDYVKDVLKRKKLGKSDEFEFDPNASNEKWKDLPF